MSNMISGKALESNLRAHILGLQPSVSACSLVERWGNIIIFVLYIFLDLFSHLVQTWRCPDLASLQPSVHVPCVFLGVFGICIVYLALACGLIHFFLSSAVTTGSEVQRFYFQARLLVILVTLKPHNEKLTFQNKDTYLNFYSSFSTA